MKRRGAVPELSGWQNLRYLAAELMLCWFLKACDCSWLQRGLLTSYLVLDVINALQFSGKVILIPPVETTTMLRFKGKGVGIANTKSQ